MSTRYFIGPMTKNVVDAVMEINEAFDNHIIGLIPSRRQIEFNGGYVNNWTTEQFCKYVYDKSDLTVIERDHGGQAQGSKEDDGKLSFFKDLTSGIRLLHIDPWKVVRSISDAAVLTAEHIETCLAVDTHSMFEVGTEQAIYPYSAEDLELFLGLLEKNLKNKFERIEYAVVQGGTKISQTHNTGEYDREKLSEMCYVASKFGLLSKEHNGDYLTSQSIKDRFSHGLNAINIAPEFGVFETELLLKYLSDTQFESFYDVCLKSGKWKKWVPSNFDVSDKKQLVKICGHYNIMSEVIQDFKNSNPEFDKMCVKLLKNSMIEKIL